jgi:hypothetical protein
MNKESQKDVSIEELLNVFQEIDARIKLLHEDSSDVFLQLNGFLKDYHKKHSIITGNVNKIFEAIVGKEGNGLIDEYENIYDDLRKYKEIAEKEYAKSISLIRHIKSKIDFILVLIRNFRQDLTTFKFLTTNYRLLSNTGSFDDDSTESIMKWELVAIRIKEGIGLLTNEFEKIGTKAGIILRGLEEFTGESLKNIYLYNDDLRSTNVLINRKNRESESHFPVLKEKMDNSRNSIGNIITHIQYHDIIRQKVEHIQTTHENIVNDLQENTGDENNEPLEKDEKRFSMISEISGLQSAQLILISKEYQKALEVISQNFQNVTRDLTSVSTLSNEFSYEGENSQNTLIHRVRDRMDKGVMMMDSFNFASFDREINLLTRSFQDMFKIADNLIFQPVGEFSDLIISDKKDDSHKGNSDRPKILYQLSDLLRDIVEKKDELEMDMIEVHDKILDFQKNQKGSELGSKLEKEQIRIMVNITRMLNRLDDENKELDTLLSQNYDLNQDLVNRLKETIHHADYYELFDEVLTEIIEKLNIINKKLGNGNHDTARYENISDLKDIEALYTVASERKVHDSVVSGKGGIDLFEDEPEDEDSDDLELF